jgi:hypothetical protein
LLTIEMIWSRPRAADESKEVVSHA